MYGIVTCELGLDFIRRSKKRFKPFATQEMKSNEQVKQKSNEENKSKTIIQL